MCSMKAGDELLGAVFNKDHRYVIPIFQRPYVWDEEENWTPLWHDIRKAVEEVEQEGPDGPSDAPREYFLGAFVTQHRTPVPRRIATSHVIDGQQRLTTFQVFLAAARRVAQKRGADSAADRISALVANRVASDTEHPEDAFKVTPLNTDEAAFRWAMRAASSDEVPPDTAHRIAKASSPASRGCGSLAPTGSDDRDAYTPSAFSRRSRIPSSRPDTERVRLRRPLAWLRLGAALFWAPLLVTATAGSPSAR